MISAVATVLPVYHSKFLASLALLWQLIRIEGFAAVRAAGWWRLRECVEDCVTEGGEAWLRWRPEDSFSPLGFAEPAGLEEGVGDHRHERVSVQASPRAALEVIEAKFFHAPVRRPSGP